MEIERYERAKLLLEDIKDLEGAIESIIRLPESAKVIIKHPKLQSKDLELPTGIVDLVQVRTRLENELKIKRDMFDKV